MSRERCDLVIDKYDGILFVVVAELNYAGHILRQQMEFFVAAC